MTEYAYDPEFPYIVESRKTGRYVARFADPMKAMHYASDNEGLWVIDTTPRPKIPEDARFLLYTDASGTEHVAVKVDTDGGHVWWNGSDRYEKEPVLLALIGSREITVLIPKEEA